MTHASETGSPQDMFDPKDTFDPEERKRLLNIITDLETNDKKESAEWLQAQVDYNQYMADHTANNSTALENLRHYRSRLENQV